MAKSDGEFVAIVDLAEGEHQYKFVVDGNWEHDPTQNSIDDNYNGRNNVIELKRSDFESSDAVAPVLERAVTESVAVPSAIKDMDEIPSLIAQEETAEAPVQERAVTIKDVDEVVNVIPSSLVAQEKPAEEPKEAEKPAETNTQNLIEIEPTPVVAAAQIAEPEPVVQATPAVVVDEVTEKQINDILEAFEANFEDFEAKEQQAGAVETMETENHAATESSVVPEEKQETALVVEPATTAISPAIKALEKEEEEDEEDSTTQLFSQVARDDDQLIADLQEPQEPLFAPAAPSQDNQLLADFQEPAHHHIDMFSELKKLAQLAPMPSSDFELLEVLKSNFQDSNQVEEEPEQTDEIVEDLFANEPAAKQLVVEEVETQQDKLIDEVPSSDTECLIAEAATVEDNVVEIIDLTDAAAIQKVERPATERRQSIVIEHKDQARVCDLEQTAEANSSEKLIKSQAAEQTDMKSRLLDQPFFQRLNSLSLKEKLMVCFGGLVAVFVFAASVFL